MENSNVHCFGLSKPNAKKEPLSEQKNNVKTINLLDQKSSSESLDPKLLEIVSDITQSTIITDLNTDCMEYICDNLELKDLLSLADSSKRFYIPVCRSFKKKYCKSMLQIAGERYDLQIYFRKYFFT